MEKALDNLVSECFGENNTDVTHNRVVVKSELTDALELTVFFNSYYGFNSTSTLICGRQNAILVSATFLISDAHKLVAGIMETGKNLTHIIIPEFHPDHHFGAKVLQDAFPGVEIVAAKGVADDIIRSADDKTQMWGKIFGKNVPEQLLFPKLLTEDYLELEGHKLEISEGWQGDVSNETLVWIPSIRAMIPTDMVFYKAYAFTIESDTARRELWKDDLEKLKKMAPLIVIPGHAPISGFSTDPSVIDYTIEYLDYFDEVLSQAKTGDEMINRVEKKYKLKALRYILHWHIRFLFPDSCSDKILPIPGIFRGPGE